MLARISILIFLLCFVRSSEAQTCDEDDGLFDLFDFWISDEESVQNDTQSIFDDSLRTEGQEWNYALSVLAPVGGVNIHPIGMSMGMNKQFRKLKRMYVGGSFSLHNYGSEKYDTLLGDYDHISTNNSLYDFGLSVKYQILNLDDFKAFFGLEIGTTFFRTVSKAVDTDCSCEQKRPKTLHKVDSGKTLFFGTFLGLSIPLGSIYDRFLISFGYRMGGDVTYVDKRGVDIRPNNISYLESSNAFQMLSIQIGVSHFF